MLPTDYSSPGTGVLARLSDTRVAQYWDQDHLFAKQLAKSENGQAKPNCCTSKGIDWDEVIVYRRSEQWNSELPRADYWSGPVVRSTDFVKRVDLNQE